MTSTILLPDLYESSCAQPDFTRLASDPRFWGAWLKATEGVAYAPAAGWFRRNWTALRDAGGVRYGDTWFRGAYHFLRFSDDPRVQADFFLRTIDEAGGFEDGDLIPAVDVERAGGNAGASRARVIDCVLGWSARVKDALGCGVLLYGRGAMRDLGITGQMGCDYLWAPEYGPRLESTDALGWPADQVMLWQYTDGKINMTSLPSRAPGVGATDLSVWSGEPADFRSRMLMQPTPTPVSPVDNPQ